MKKVISIILICILLFIACDRYIDSDSPVRSLPDPLPAPVNIIIQLNNRSVTLTWEMTDSTDVNKFRVYVAELGQTAFVLRDSSTTYTATVENLAVNRTYFFQVAAVGNNGYEGARSNIVSTDVNLISISIENGREAINRRQVSVQLAAVNASHVILSEDQTFSDAEYQSYTPTKTFTLSQGDGVKRLYAGFIFDDGTESGTPVSDSINLDTRLQIDSVFFSPEGPIFVPGDTLIFGIDAGDMGQNMMELNGEALIYLGPSDSVWLYDDGLNGDAVADDGIYTTTYVVPEDATVAAAFLLGKFIDAAGNIGDMYSAKSLTIVSSPREVQLTQVSAISSWQVELNWTRFVGDDFLNYRIYRDTDSTFDNSPDYLVRTINSENTVTYTDTTIDDDTWYYYRIFVTNTYGAVSSSSNVDSIRTPVNQPPDSIVLTAFIADSATIRLNWTQSNDEDFAYYRIFRSLSPLSDPPSTSQSVAILSNRGTTSFDNYAPSSGDYHYRVYVYDKQGAFTGSNQVIVTRFAK